MSAASELKVVVVGDSPANKTAVATFTAKAASPDNDISMSENIEITTTHQGQQIHMQIFDTTGQEGFLRMRSLSYPKTNVFLLCFSFLDLQSFINIKENWLPEVLSYCPTAALLIVGTDYDQLMLDGPGEPKRPEGETLPTPDQGRALAEELKPNCVGFSDLSSSTGNGAAELLTKLLSHIVSNKQDEKGAPSPANRQQSARPSLMSRAKSTFRRRNTVGSDAATTPTTRHSLSSSSSSSASSSPATERAAPQQGTFRRALTATLRGLRPGRGRATLEEAGTVPPPVEAETVLPPVEAAQPPAPLEADAPLNDAAAADEEPQPQPPAPEESHE